MTQSISTWDAVSVSHPVQQELGLRSIQQAEAGCGLQDHGGDVPHGGGDAGLRQLQKLHDSCRTLDTQEEAERSGHTE